MITERDVITARAGLPVELHFQQHFSLPHSWYEFELQQVICDPTFDSYVLMTHDNRTFSKSDNGRDGSHVLQRHLAGGPGQRERVIVVLTP